MSHEIYQHENHKSVTLLFHAPEREPDRERDPEPDLDREPDPERERLPEPERLPEREREPDPEREALFFLSIEKKTYYNSLSSLY